MTAEQEDELAVKGKGRNNTAQEREEVDRERFMEVTFYFSLDTQQTNFFFKQIPCCAPAFEIMNYRSCKMQCSVSKEV